MSNEQIVVDGLTNGDAKAVILTKLVQGGMTLPDAGTLYLEVGRGKGLLLDAEAKVNLIAEVVSSNTKDEKLDRDAAVAALVERGRMTKSTATSRIKGYCLENKIDFPQAVRTHRDMDAVNAAFKKWTEDGVAREGIEAGLVEHFGYTEKSVKQAYLKIGKDLGLIESGGAQGRVDLAAWFANPEKVAGTKKEIVERLMTDTKVAKATAETRYGMFLFAKDYVKALG